MYVMVPTVDALPRYYLDSIFEFAMAVCLSFVTGAKFLLPDPSGQ